MVTMTRMPHLMPTNTLPTLHRSTIPFSLSTVVITHHKGWYPHKEGWYLREWPLRWYHQHNHNNKVTPNSWMGGAFLIAFFLSGVWRPGTQQPTMVAQNGGILGDRPQVSYISAHTTLTTTPCCTFSSIIAARRYHLAVFWSVTR